MNVIAIVQARMGSTRLPGKVLMDMGGRPVLERVVRRLQRSSTLSKIIVAATDSARDEPILRACEQIEVACFCGSEYDVLDRYYQCALAESAEVVVRITSDCPLIDPDVVDAVVEKFHAGRAEYVSNCSPRTFPRGLDTEVFTFDALARAWSEAQSPHQREHVTPYFYEHPRKFRLAFLTGADDYSRLRWTLDTLEDLVLLKAIYSYFNNRDDFTWREAVRVMEQHPELAELNAHIQQKPMVAS